MGYIGVFYVIYFGVFGCGFGYIWMDDVNCGGGELLLLSCGYCGWGSYNCGYWEDVGVVCRV